MRDAVAKRIIDHIGDKEMEISLRDSTKHSGHVRVENANGILYLVIHAEPKQTRDAVYVDVQDAVSIKPYR